MVGQESVPNLNTITSASLVLFYLVDVGMPDLADESHGGGVVGVVVRELQVSLQLIFYRRVVGVVVRELQVSLQLITYRRVVGVVVRELQVSLQLITYRRVVGVVVRELQVSLQLIIISYRRVVGFSFIVKAINLSIAELVALVWLNIITPRWTG